MFLLLTALAVLVLGIIEKSLHDHNLKLLTLRINVNGTRGKSTVTRLITAILKEAGYKVVGKTTGTSARILFWNSEEEKPIKRGPLGPNIIEQKKVVKEAVKCGAEAFVTECMAVNPDYQIVFQEQLIKAQVGVIVNVREDHLDLCGPTLDNIAESFTATIPYKGKLVITDSNYNEYFSQVAAARNTQIYIADESELPNNYLSKFKYVIFPENASIALAVAKALGIDRKVALRGMLKANPDPGALHIHALGQQENNCFVNAFAANDPNSTLMIWRHIKTLGYATDDALFILNCRPDRVDRTIQFAEDVLAQIQIDTLLVMGKTVKPVTDAWETGKIRAKHYVNLEERSVTQVFDKIKELSRDRLIFAAGNIHGGGEELVDMIILELKDDITCKAFPNSETTLPNNKYRHVAS